MTGKADEALAAHRRALEVREALARDPAAVLDDRLALANSHNDIGIVLGSVRETAGALAESRKGLELMRALAPEGLAVAEYRRGLAVSHGRVGKLLALAGRPAEALVEFDRA